MTYQASHDDRITFRTEQISIGLTNYRRDPETEEWRVDSHPNVTPLDELELTPESLQALEFGPDRILEGEGVFHLRGRIWTRRAGCTAGSGSGSGGATSFSSGPSTGSNRLRASNTTGRSTSPATGINRDWAASDAESPVAPITADDLQGEPIDPRDISWENVTLDEPGRALVTGTRSEDGDCGTSIHLSGGSGESQTSGGRWGRTIWTDSDRCVHLIEYGHSTEEDRDRFNREQPGGSVVTAVPQPAEQPQR